MVESGPGPEGGRLAPLCWAQIFIQFHSDCEWAADCFGASVPASVEWVRYR